MLFRSGRPVVVGGHGVPGERAVVSTASYEAREFGVGSGMPMVTARRTLPDAVFLPVDAEAYTAASEAVMGVLRSYEALVVEVLGWDEAFIGVPTSDPEAWAREIRQAVYAATELHSSTGIGDNRLRAKIATGFAKPQGIYRLTEANWYPVMGARPPDALWGIGSRTAKKLETMGVTTVRQLVATPDDELAAVFGPKMGPWIGSIGRGEASAEVSAEPWVPRSHSRETTFPRNLADWAEVAEQARVLAARVAEDIRDEGRPGVRVGLKVRYAPFSTHTTSRALPEPTFDAEILADAAVALLERLDHDREVRLLGVRVEMTPPAQKKSGLTT